MRTIVCILVLMTALLVAGSVNAAQPKATDTTDTNKEASGPYITTDPQTGDRILGVARQAQECEEPERYGTVYVVPEIEVPAQLEPAKPVQIYRPGTKPHLPGVYRPGQ